MQQTGHVFELSGLGQAPFRCVDVISHPSPSLAESNLSAYQNTLSWIYQRASGYGVSLCTCQYCGHDLVHNYVIRDSAGKCFVVGCDCVEKTGDAGLIRAAKAAQKAAELAKKRAEAEERWEAERLEREAANAARAAAEEQAEAIRAEEARKNAESTAWIAEILEGRPGDFCQGIAADLRKGRALSDLPDRAFYIVQDVVIKEAGRGLRGAERKQAMEDAADRFQMTEIGW